MTAKTMMLKNESAPGRGDLQLSKLPLLQVQQAAWNKVVLQVQRCLRATRPTDCMPRRSGREPRPGSLFAPQRTL